MTNKTVIVEMSEELANWLALMPTAEFASMRIIGEFVPAVAAMGRPAPLTIKPMRGNGEHKKQEFPRGTKVKMQHRPPAEAPMRREAWGFLKDKFADTIFDAKEARQFLKTKGITSASSMVTAMMRLRELRPVADKG
jgi:hypothetical protein